MSGICLANWVGVQQLRMFSLFTYFLPRLQLINLTMLQKMDLTFSNYCSPIPSFRIARSTTPSDLSQLLKKENSWFTMFDSLFFFADSSSFSSFLNLLFFGRRHPFRPYYHTPAPLPPSLAQLPGRMPSVFSGVREEREGAVGAKGRAQKIPFEGAKRDCRAICGEGEVKGWKNTQYGCASFPQNMLNYIIRGRSEISRVQGY